MLIDIQEARRLLPPVGAILRRVPGWQKAEKDDDNKNIHIPLECQVVEVHPGHLWYRVRYENGIHECFKAVEG